MLCVGQTPTAYGSHSQLEIVHIAQNGNPHEANMRYANWYFVYSVTMQQGLGKKEITVSRGWTRVIDLGFQGEITYIDPVFSYNCAKCLPRCCYTHISTQKSPGQTFGIPSVETQVKLWWMGGNSVPPPTFVCTCSLFKYTGHNSPRGSPAQAQTEMNRSYARTWKCFSLGPINFS